MSMPSRYSTTATILSPTFAGRGVPVTSPVALFRVENRIAFTAGARRRMSGRTARNSLAVAVYEPRNLPSIALIMLLPL